MAEWLDALVKFGMSNKDWLAPVVGAAAGALSGSKSQTTTQNSAPVLPENVKTGYDKLIADAMTAYGRPIEARPTKRVETGGNAFQQLFQNPEMQMIQAQADAAYQQPQPQAQSDTQPNVTSAQGYASPEEQMLERLQMYSQGRNNGGGQDANAKAAERLLYDYNLNKNTPDGQVNQYTGQPFNKAEYLAGMNGQLSNMAYGKNEGLFSQANREVTPEQMAQRDKVYAATYRPSQSKQTFLGKYGAPLMLAAMGGGLGYGASLLSGPAMAGSITPAMGAQGFKGLTSLATRGV
jgi:hypothetical protein